MENNCTKKNFGIKDLIKRFWQQTALVCCLVLMFACLCTTQKAYSQDTLSFNALTGLLGSPGDPSCITNSASVSDLFECEHTSAEIGLSIGGLVSPTPGGPISWQWQVALPLGPDIPGTNCTNIVNGSPTGYGGTYENATGGATPDGVFGRDLFITDVDRLDSAEYRVILTFNDGYCTNPLTTNFMTLTVFYSPIVNVTWNPDPICSGSPGTSISKCIR